MKCLLCIVSVVFALLVSPRARADSLAVRSANNDLYELRAYMDLPLRNLNDSTPVVKAQVQDNKYFFSSHILNHANKKNGNSTWMVSGFLHPTQKGKFLLDYTLVVADEIGGVRAIYSSTQAQITLDKPYESLSSEGVVTGYMVVISKVSRPTETHVQARASVYAGKR